MKQIVLFTAILITCSMQTWAQDDCKCKVQIAGNAGFQFGPSGRIAAEIKVGAWYLNIPFAPNTTLFVGWTSDDVQSAPEDKGRRSSVGAESLFIEAGYRQRFNDRWAGHALIGKTTRNLYTGAEMLFAVDNSLQAGIGYKTTRSINLSFYVKL